MSETTNQKFEAPEVVRMLDDLQTLCSRLITSSMAAGNVVSELLKANALVPLKMAELFEELANRQLDIVALISAQHRRKAEAAAEDFEHDAWNGF
ncbi:hypothetical protein [Aureimonas sp. ME7]|uniref:hypothetical protein n=1 Tax=Aureimonas sp. ME7 TaxID=2744252 RepID=UPI0015FAE1CC|nr:hypothetical protein [Aureimonas sp. ME7]